MRAERGNKKRQNESTLVTKVLVFSCVAGRNESQRAALYVPVNKWPLFYEAG